jgi:RNA-binding protein 5/10
MPSLIQQSVPSHLQKWKDRQAELHGTPSSKAEEPSSMKEQTASAKPGGEDGTLGPIQSYADLKRMCCYLCSRQFKTEAELNKHERLSQLHQDNLQNEELRGKALQKVDRAGLPIVQERSMEYRDRAKERRQTFGQPKKPSVKPQGGSKSVKAGEAAKSEKAAVPSKGASLLGKMGWAAGQGLGATGDGMINPLETNVYAQGVGLGAAGGKLGDASEEAERRTIGGYAAFVKKTQDNARDRFQQLEEEKE